MARNQASGGGGPCLMRRVLGMAILSLSLTALAPVGPASASGESDRSYRVYLKDGQVVTGSKPFVGFGVVRFVDASGRERELDAGLVDLERSRDSWRERSLADNLDDFPAPGTRLAELRAVGLGPGLTFVEIWPTYCKPCVKTLSEVRALQDRHPELNVLSICFYDLARQSWERREGLRPEHDRGRWEKLIAQQGLDDRKNWRNIHLLGAEAHDLRRELIQSPRVNNGLLVTREGEVIASGLSHVTLEVVEQALRRSAARAVVSSSGEREEPGAPR